MPWRTRACDNPIYHKSWGEIFQRFSNHWRKSSFNHWWQSSGDVKQSAEALKQFSVRHCTLTGWIFSTNKGRWFISVRTLRVLCCHPNPKSKIWFAEGQGKSSAHPVPAVPLIKAEPARKPPPPPSSSSSFPIVWWPISAKDTEEGIANNRWDLSWSSKKLCMATEDSSSAHSNPSISNIFHTQKLDNSGSPSPFVTRTELSRTLF